MESTRRERQGSSVIYCY